MAKLTTNPINSRYGSIDALNDNFTLIEEAVEKTLSRTGDDPNYMEANLDMNSNSILNANIVNARSITINGVPLVPGNNTGTVAEAGQVVIQYTATNGQTDFDVDPYSPTSATILVFVNGLLLPPTTVAVSGTVVTVPALEAGDEVNIVVFATPTTPTAIYNLSSYVPVKTVAATTYTITADDYGYFILFTSNSAVTVTIADSVSDFSSGNGGSFIACQKGSGQVTLQADTGVTIVATSTAATRTQNSVIAAQCIADASWVVFGDMAA